ncbi:MAG: hypothetical protein A3G75_07770 [Verrucomicrobia bacterium RIFCSPLOWO2_12_FULL_64_8]|nr:MAG: hypothetical protein A3G75_07770 [Verrucomicrobia bacterium RIFCSPLOWO2_12_FULL_64_8]
MTFAFLFFANLVLITRLCCQLQPSGVHWGRWGTKMGIELAALALFEWHSWLLAAAATVIVMNVAGVLWEALGWRRNTGHLALGILYLLTLSVWFSPMFGLKFWPVIEQAATAAGRWTAFEVIFHSSLTYRAMLTLFGLLVAMSEMNLAVRAVFDGLDLQPRMAESEEVDVVAYDRGRIIGFLERALAYLFVLAGNYLVVGLLLIAKVMIYNRRNEDRVTAEYGLIGTLLSAILSIAVAELVKYLMTG